MERLNLQFYANCIIFLHDRETFLFWDFFSKNGKSDRLKRNQGEVKKWNAWSKYRNAIPIEFYTREIALFMYARVRILINSILQSCRNPKTRYRCNLRANRIANGTIRPTIKCRHYKRSSPSSRLTLYGRFIRVNFVLSKRVLIPSSSPRYTIHRGLPYVPGWK